MENKLLHHKQTMQSFKGLINREKDCARTVDANQNWTQVLENTLDRTEDTFTVLIMGGFSAGKTTMINALIGERLLPMSATPTTAIMTELKYADEKKVIMYPKKGTNVDGRGDKPFAVPATTESIERYVTIDNDAGINVTAEDSVKIASQFEKMELFWPLEILKNGVTIVDSPGLNDPYCNDEIVRKYLPKADAVIYAINSTLPYSKQDKDELTRLNIYGIKNVIFTYTYWDQVAFDGEKALLKTKKYCLDNALTHTNLRENGIHFLSSRDGLQAHIEGNQDKWIESGYQAFESFLADYLTKARGLDKVNNLVATMSSEAQKIKKYVEALNNNAFQDTEVLRQRMEHAEDELKILKKSGDKIAENFNLMLQTKRPGIEKSIDEFLPTLRTSVDLDDFTPETKLPEGLAKLNPFGKKELAQKMYDEVHEEYRRRLKNSVQTWIADKLYAQSSDALKYASEGVKNDVENFSTSLEKIQAEITVSDIEKATSGAASSIVLGAIYGILTNDWFTAGSVAVFGKDTMFRQLAFQAAWGAAAGIALVAGIPITWPVIIAGGVIASLVGILTSNTERKAARMKRDILGKLRAAYFDEKEDGEPSDFLAGTKMSLLNGVDNTFDKATEEIRYAIEEDIAIQKRSIEAILENDMKSESQKKEEIKQRKQAVKELDEIIKEAEELKKNYS